MILYFYLIFLTLSKSNIQCSSAFCSSCDVTGTICHSCIDNYIKQGDICVYCRDVDPYCQKANQNKCVECFDGYFINNGKCEKKDISCEKYSNGRCIECEDGYLLNNGICEKCQIKGCEDCRNGINTCYECVDGYVPINGTCQQPIENCEEYEKTHNGKYRCEECFNGYVLNKEKNICEKIETNNCRIMNVTTGQCEQCFGPYKPVNGVCTSEEAKSDVIPHCIDYDGKFECDECEPGYYTNRYDNECLKCEGLCKTCDDGPNDCIRCIEGYYAVGSNDDHDDDDDDDYDRKLKKDTKKCIQCTQPTNGMCGYKTKAECFSCNNKCNWYNNACIESHCIEYKENEENVQCIQCEQGYVLEKIQKIRLTKKDHDDDDDDDDDDEHTEYTCVLSTDGCKEKNGNKCIECHMGYFMKEDFTCGECDSKCKECSGSATSCHSCYPTDYSKSKTTCTQCSDPNCISCPFSIDTCVKCKGNYTVDELGFCKMGCFTEDCDGKCTMCADQQNNMDIVYPPTTEGRCFVYSQMPNTPNPPSPDTPDTPNPPSPDSPDTSDEKDNGKLTTILIALTLILILMI